MDIDPITAFLLFGCFFVAGYIALIGWRVEEITKTPRQIAYEEKVFQSHLRGFIDLLLAIALCIAIVAKLFGN